MRNTRNIRNIRNILFVLLAAAAVMACRVYGQVRPPTYAIAAKSGTVANIPVHCIPGYIYFATDATAGSNWYLCTATDTWTQQTGSGASGVTSFSGDGALLSNSSSTGAVTTTLGNAGAYSLWGNNTGSSASPGYISTAILGGNGAASAPAFLLNGTVFTGGSGTTTWPMSLVQPSGTTTTAWSANGTILGGNAPSGFTGNLIDLQVNGTSYFSVPSNGGVGDGCCGIVIGNLGNRTAINSHNNNTGICLQNQGTGSSGGLVNGAGYVDVMNGNTLSNSSLFFVPFEIAPRYNQTSTAGAIDLLIYRTEAAVGSGEQAFEDFRVGGTAKYYVDHSGAAVSIGVAFASLPTCTASTVDSTHVPVGALILLH